MKEAIIEATKAKPLAKEEIFEAVKKLGYQFTTKKPMASINVVLYSKNPKFKNQDGKFSAAQPGKLRSAWIRKRGHLTGRKE